MQHLAAASRSPRRKSPRAPKHVITLDEHGLYILGLAVALAQRSWEERIQKYLGHGDMDADDIAFVMLCHGNLAEIEKVLPQVYGAAQ